MHQWDFAGANVSTCAALYTVEKVVFFGFIVFLCFGVPKHLLGEQRRRACVGACATANTGALCIVVYQLFFCRNQQTVCGFNHGDRSV